MTGSRSDDASWESAQRRYIVWAPLRMLAGLAIGTTCAAAVILSVWLPIMPISFDPAIELVGLFVGVLTVFGVLSAVAFALRPLGTPLTIGVTVVVVVIAGLVLGARFDETRRLDCLRGTGPQETWCDNTASERTKVILTHGAGALILSVPLVLLGWRRNGSSGNGHDLAVP
jgi:hypothetical protein